MRTLNCRKCNWKKEITNEIDLKELVEVGCRKCSGRKFKCPKCGYFVKVNK